MTKPDLTKVDLSQTFTEAEIEFAEGCEEIQKVQPECGYFYRNNELISAYYWLTEEHYKEDAVWLPTEQEARKLIEATGYIVFSTYNLPDEQKVHICNKAREFGTTKEFTGESILLCYYKALHWCLKNCKE
jgi:hypothetical protein